MTVGIFPAAGALGTSTYTHLLDLGLVEPSKLILVNRHPEKVPRSRVDAGVRVRRASYESSPAELEEAFAGVDVLFLVSYPDFVHEYRVKVHLPAIDAARRAGVRHIIYSSLAFAGDHGDASAAVVMQAHLDTERYLAGLTAGDKGFTYTAVREGLYSESTPIYTGFWDPADPAQPDQVPIPHDGAAPGVAWAKRDELGEASARLIGAYVSSSSSSLFRYVNARVLLTGPRVWSLAETVRELARAAGRAGAAGVRQVSVDEYARLPAVLGRFKTEEKAKAWATAWEAIRAGETAVVTGELEKLLGRKPEEFNVTVARKFGLK